MAVKGVLKNVPLALQSFKNSLKGTEWEGLLPEVKTRIYKNLVKS